MLKYFIAVCVISAFVIGVVIYAFNSIGGPGETRREKFDQTRVSSISGLKYAVENYYYKNGKLPSAVDELDASTTQDLKDPQTNQRYEYKPVSVTSYQLCATFDTDNTVSKKSNPAYYLDDQFKHAKGHYCFDLKVSGVTSNGPSLNSGPVTADDYNGVLTSAYGAIAHKKTKVAQTFKLNADTTVKGIKGKFMYSSSGVAATVNLRQRVHENDLERGDVITSGEIPVGVINQKQDQTILFKDPVKLSAGIEYVLVFEAADNGAVLNVYYTSKNPDSSGSAYYYFDPLGQAPQSATYSWNNYADYDFYYELLV